MKSPYLAILFAVASTSPAAYAVQEGHGNPIFIEADCHTVASGGPAARVMVTRDPFSPPYTLDVAAPGLDLNESATRIDSANAGTPGERPLTYASASARLEIFLTDLPVEVGAPLVRRGTVQAERAGKAFRATVECTLHLNH